MTKKKELTLQDLLENMQNMYTGLCSSIDMLTFRLNQVLEGTAEISNCSKMEQSDTESRPENALTNKDYITITANDVLVGGESATEYNGEKIYNLYHLPAYFKELRDIVREEYNVELLEIQCMQSSTQGTYPEQGNPVPDKSGVYSWCRCVWKNKDGNTVSPLAWVFRADRGSASACAYYCATNCAYAARFYSAFRAALFLGASV